MLTSLSRYPYLRVQSVVGVRAAARGCLPPRHAGAYGAHQPALPLAQRQLRLGQRRHAAAHTHAAREHMPAAHPHDPSWMGHASAGGKAGGGGRGRARVVSRVVGCRAPRRCGTRAAPPPAALDCRGCHATTSQCFTVMHAATQGWPVRGRQGWEGRREWTASVSLPPHPCHRRWHACKTRDASAARVSASTVSPFSHRSRPRSQERHSARAAGRPAQARVHVLRASQVAHAIENSP